MPFVYGIDTSYLIYVLPALIFALIAQAMVKSTFAKYAKIPSDGRMTGRDAARLILDANGLYHVAVTEVAGELTDHFDPKANVIRLSQSVYGVSSAAAVGVAAHEAGHAVQYAEKYLPMKIRSAIIPATQLGSKFSFILLFAGLLFYSQALFLLGIALFSLTTIFQLVTLPVEFNASARALETIEGQQLLDYEELSGARKVLRAAALTYVAALLMSALQLLRYVLIFFGRGGRRGGGRE